MKKILLVITSIIFVNITNAQDKKFFDQIFLLYNSNKIADAKAKIDAEAQNPKTKSNSEYWLWKSFLDIYTLRSGTPCENCVNSSFEAFKKYADLDPSLKQAGEIPFKWQNVYGLYEDFFNLGATAFRNKDYQSAFTNFENTIYFSNILVEQNLKSIDTIPFLYAGYAAQNSKNYKDAAKYLSILADRKYAVKEDLDLYKLLLVDYIELKDKANFEKYLAIAQEVMPNENFADYKMDFLNKNTNLKEKLEFYKVEDANNRFDDEDYFYFGGLFSSFTKEEKAKLETEPEFKQQLFNTAIDAFKKSYNKKTNGIAAFNIGILTYQNYNAIKDVQSDNIKNLQTINAEIAAEKDPKKKATLKEKIEPIKKANSDLDIKIMEAANQSIEWHEKAVADLKDKTEKREKNCYKNAINMLANLFAYKMDKLRGKDLKGYDAAEAKFKYYDDLGSKL